MIEYTPNLYYTNIILYNMQWVFYTVLQYKQTVLVLTSPEEVYKLWRRRRRRSSNSTIYVYDYTWPLPWQTECEHLIASLNHADALPQPPRRIFQSHPFRRTTRGKKNRKKIYCPTAETSRHESRVSFFSPSLRLTITLPNPQSASPTHKPCGHEHSFVVPTWILPRALPRKEK